MASNKTSPLVAEVDAALVDRDPVRIEATLRSDGDGVTVTFDGDVESVASERV